MSGVAFAANSEYAVRAGSLGLYLRKYGTALPVEGPGRPKFVPDPLGTKDVNFQDDEVHRFFVELTMNYEAVRRQQATNATNADGIGVHSQPVMKKDKKPR